MRKQWDDLNRVMRNPAPPLPESARAIKEQCIALMDETWGPIEAAHVSGYDVNKYGPYSPTQIFSTPYGPLSITDETVKELP